MYIYVYIYTYMCACMYVRMYACMHACTVHVCMYVCMYVRIMYVRGEQENLSQSMFTAEAFARNSQHAVLETFDEKRMKQTVVKITEKKHDFHKKYY